MKTNKSFSKRLRVTKTGKILARKAGQNHFNAKSPRSKQLAAKGTQTLVMSKRASRRFLPKSN